MTTERRVSIRNVSIRYGIPTGVVARAVTVGELPAIVTKTETGRDRVYIAPSDADAWFENLSTVVTTSAAQVQ
jgi:hypothetical protein